MCLFQTRHLFPQAFYIRAVSVGAGRREVRAVVNCINRVEEVFGTENMVQAHGAEVIANGLQRIIECFRDAAEVRGAGRRHRPGIDQR